MATGFTQKGFQISFKVNNTLFELNLLGRHNMENAVAATAAANLAGVSLADASAALKKV